MYCDDCCQNLNISEGQWQHLKLHSFLYYHKIFNKILKIVDGGRWRHFASDGHNSHLLQTPTPVCFNKQSPIDIHVYLTRIKQKRQCTLKCEGLLICLSKYLKNRDKYCLCWGLNQCPLACKSITVCTLPIELKS